MLEIPQQSRIKIAVRVLPVTELGAPADPTDDPVNITFSLASALNVDEGQWDHPWLVGEWFTTAAGEIFVRRMIGPGSTPTEVVLAPGQWWPFVQPEDAPEVPVVRGKPFRII